MDATSGCVAIASLLGLYSGGEISLYLFLMLPARIFKLLLIVALCVLGSGCGTRDDTGGKTVLRLGYMADQRNQAFIKVLLETFHAKHPDIEVDPVFATGHYEQKITTMLAGGDPLDLFMVSTFRLAEYAERNTLLELDSFAENDAEFQAAARDIFPAALEDAEYGGRAYRMPFWTNAIVLYYNKDHFDAAGLAYPDDTWTWNDLLAACKELTRDEDGDGRFDQYALYAPLSMWFFGGLSDYIRQHDAQLFSEDMSECLIDSPDVLEAIRFWYDLALVHKAIPSPLGADKRFENSEESFMTGRLAMTITGRWSMKIFEKADFEWSLAPLPRGKVRYVPIGNAHMAASRKTKHPEACWTFLKFLVSEEAQQLITEVKTECPVRISVAESDLFRNGYGRQQENDVIIKELRRASPIPTFPGQGEWLDFCRPELDEVLLGRQTLEEAARKIKKQYAKIRAEHGL